MSGGPTRANSGGIQRPPTTFAAPVTVENNQPLGVNKAAKEDSNNNQPPPQQPSGPTRSNSGGVQRPPTTFAAPITNDPKSVPGVKNNNINNDNNNNNNNNRGNAPRGGGPTPAGQRVQRPPTTFVSEPISPVKLPPGVPQKQNANVPAVDNTPAAKINVNELFRFSACDELWDSKTAQQLKANLTNPNTVKEVFLSISNPFKCSFFSGISRGLGEEKIMELHNKMYYIASQLIFDVNTKQIHDLVFKNDLLDHLYSELLTQKAPLVELRAHYLREIFNHYAKYQKVPLLKYLSEKFNNVPRAKLMLDHFYNENVGYLFDEMLTLEEETAKEMQAKQAESGGTPGRGAPRGSPQGPPRGGPARGGPGAGGPGRGGPPQGSPRGGPPRGRGDGPGAPRGGRGDGPGRGGPPRGRGGAQGGGPAPAPSSPRWSRSFDFLNELLAQLEGSVPASSPQTKYQELIFKEGRVTMSAHVILGLLFRGWDSATLKDIFTQVDRFVDGCFQPWVNGEAFESRLKVIKAIIMATDRQWLWDESLPKAQHLRRTTDSILKHFTTGTFRQNLNNPVAASITYPKLSVLSETPGGPVGIVRIKLIELFGYFLDTQYLKLYEDQIIQSGIIKQLLEMFYTYQHNYFLHETISKDIFNFIMQGKSEALYVHLFVDCDFAEEIVKHFQGVSKARSKKASSFVSYNGHLLSIAKQIQSNKLLQKPSITAKINHQSWANFIATDFADITKAQIRGFDQYPNK